MEPVSPNNNPEDVKDIEGYFPIRRALKKSKTSEPFDLCFKGVRIMAAKAMKGEIIKAQAEGGAKIVAVVGASVWQMDVTFSDLELLESNKRIITNG